MPDYIGKCKNRQCRRALKVTDEAESVRMASSAFVYVSEGYEATDPTIGYCVGNWGAYARCPEHGLYALRTVVGRLVPDHKCDARCTGATGPKCDCACGGKNHGNAHGAGPLLQVTLTDAGQLEAEPVPTPEERHETMRLFQPAPTPMKGQTTLEL